MLKSEIKVTLECDNSGMYRRICVDDKLLYADNLTWEAVKHDKSLAGELMGIIQKMGFSNFGDVNSRRSIGFIAENKNFKS